MADWIAGIAKTLDPCSANLTSRIFLGFVLGSGKSRRGKVKEVSKRQKKLNNQRSSNWSSSTRTGNPRILYFPADKDNVPHDRYGRIAGLKVVQLQYFLSLKAGVKKTWHLGE